MSFIRKIAFANKLICDVLSIQRNAIKMKIWKDTIASYSGSPNQTSELKAFDIIPIKAIEINTDPLNSSSVNLETLSRLQLVEKCPPRSALMPKKSDKTLNFNISDKDHQTTSPIIDVHYVVQKKHPNLISSIQMSETMPAQIEKSNLASDTSKAVLKKEAQMESGREFLSTDQSGSTLFILALKAFIFGSAVWWTTQEGIWGDSSKTEAFWNKWLYRLYLKLNDRHRVHFADESLLIPTHPPMEEIKDDIVRHYNQLIINTTEKLAKHAPKHLNYSK